MKSPLPAPVLRTGLGSLLLLATAALAQAPLTLTDAIRATLANSEEARLIDEKSSKLEAQRSELWAGALPSLQGYANAGRGHQPISTESFPIKDTTGMIPSLYSVTQNTFSYGVQATQPLFSFGRLNQAFHTASKQIGSQNAANRRARQELELQALDGFYGVVLAEARLKVLAASLERQSRTVDFLESNFRRGAGSRSTLLLTQSSLKALEPQRIRAEQDALAARMAFNRLTGHSVLDPVTLDTTSLPEFSIPAGDTSEASVERVLERRPDLEALRLQTEALRGYARAYRMQYLPALAAQGKLGVLAYQFDKQLTDFDNNLEWQVGVGLSWPLFDGLANSAKARQYDSDARTLALSERQAHAYARIQLEGARREVVAADTALSAAQQARDAAAEAADLIGRDFRAGAGQVTDLLSAEEGLRNAELGLLAARYQNTRARAALRVSLGLDLIEGASK